MSADPVKARDTRDGCRFGQREGVSAMRVLTTLILVGTSVAIQADRSIS